MPRRYLDTVPQVYKDVLKAREASRRARSRVETKDGTAPPCRSAKTESFLGLYFYVIATPHMELKLTTPRWRVTGSTD